MKGAKAAGLPWGSPPAAAPPARRTRTTSSTKARPWPRSRSPRTAGHGRTCRRSRARAASR
eukprot:8846382-Alexandrium_andersonii.AAC.1